MRARRGTVNSQWPGASMKSDDKSSPKNINAVSTRPFSQMSAGEKASHVGKVIVFFITAGFAYPGIFTD
jgi:hypothetical protein